jgi:glycosyltransferase involved in cell wall biosynthesis
VRITLVIAGLGGGGAERVCINLANAWAAREHQSTILTLSQHSRPPAYTIDSRVERRDVGLPRPAHAQELDEESLASIRRLLHDQLCPQFLPHVAILAMFRHAILATQPDVVVSFIDITNLRVIAAMAETQVPVVACEVTDARRVSLGKLQNARTALYRCAAAVVAPDPVIARWLGPNARAIPNVLVPPQGKRGLKGDRRRLVTLSRLSSEKRPEFLIRSFAGIATDFPDWDLEIYGLGPQRNFLEHLVEVLAPKRVHFHGFTPEPYEVLAKADLFVSASRIEGFGNAIWEALACGVPVVAMDAGPPVRTLVRDGIDGVIVTEQTMAALAEALARLMRDEVTRKAYASRAAEVLVRFSTESSLAKWDELFRAISFSYSAT